MKLFAIGLWVTLVALGTAYAVAVYLPAMASHKAAAAPTLQYTKTRVLNVPMIAKGMVQGFMSVQFGFTVDEAAAKTVNVPPEAYLLDEAFRTIYADSSIIDPKNLSKYDLPKLTAHVVGATNDHLGAPVVKDVLIEQFSYIPKDLTKG